MGSPRGGAPRDHPRKAVGPGPAAARRGGRGVPRGVPRPARPTGRVRGRGGDADVTRALAPARPRAGADGSLGLRARGSPAGEEAGMGLVRSLLTAPLAPVAGVAWLAETIER